MLQDLWIKHREWMFEPIHYSSVDALIASLDEKIIRPAEARFAELLARKAETMRGEHVGERARQAASEFEAAAGQATCRTNVAGGGHRAVLHGGEQPVI